MDARPSSSPHFPLPDVASVSDARATTAYYSSNASNTFNHPWLSPHANFSIPLHAQSDLQYAAGTLPVALPMPSFSALPPFSLPSHNSYIPAYVPDRHVVTSPASIQARRKRRRRLDQRVLARTDDFTVDACQREIVVQSDPSSCKHMMEFRLSTCPYQISSFVSATNNLTYSSSLTKNFMDQTLLLISCHQFQNMKPLTYRG